MILTSMFFLMELPEISEMLTSGLPGDGGVIWER